MESIEKLNTVYLEEKKTASTLIELMHNISEIQRDTTRTPELKLRACMALLDELSKKKGYDSFDQIHEAFVVGDSYRKCLNAIEELESALLELSAGKQNRVLAAQNALVMAQSNFDTAKAEYEQKKEIQLQSANDLVSMLLKSVSSEMAAAQDQLKQTQSVARDSILWEYKVEMRV